MLIALIEARHGQPVALQIRLKVRQRGTHAGVRIAAVAGAEYVDHAAPGNIRCRVEPGAFIPVLSVRGVQISQCPVADIRRLAAPTVVDRAHPSIGEGVVYRFEIARIGVGAEEKTVVFVGVADVDLCVVRHAVHAGTVA
ncbi:hypothetical protein D3C72_919770 [compost metagenome]